MNIFRPKSVRRLILIGFMLVTIPLIVALVHATISVDKLVRQGQRALFETVRSTQSTQQLADAIIDMERTARQYIVVGDESLLEVYKEKRASYLEISEKLSHSLLVPLQRDRLNRLMAEEDTVNDTINRYTYDSVESGDSVERYAEISIVANEMWLDNQRLVESKVNELEVVGDRSQRNLYLLSMALVPAALALAIFFAFLSARAVRSLDHAIRTLGSGDFSKPIMITGPQDLEQLGERLDWMRAKMIEANHDKTKFLQHISHELKTPLTAVREAAELLVEEVVGSLNGQQREIVAILRGNSLQLQKLIEDLLDFNTASSRTSDLRLSDVDLKKVIKNVVVDYRVAAMARQLRVHVELDEVTLQGDENKLITLVDNMLSNAIKFSPEQGLLRVTLTRAASEAIITVQDSGPGIPEEDRDKVFDAFYQCDSSPVTHVSGTGLGLSIAREYTHAHRGRIEAIEPEDGKGACLRVRLPYKQRLNS